MWDKIKTIYYIVISSSAILINTFVLLIPMFIIALLKLATPFKNFFGYYLEVLANLWVKINIIVAKIFAPTDIVLDIDNEISDDKSYLVISNHRTWLDIFILQIVFFRKINFIKFFMKFQMLYVPILGVVAWALDFPIMHRYSKEYLKKHPEKKGKDIKQTRDYCQKISKKPITIANFVEGTRFTKEKQKKNKSEYKFLLNPKAGGIAVILNSLEHKLEGVLNTTIIYERSQEKISRFLAGKVKKIIVKVEFLKLSDIPYQEYFSSDNKKLAFRTWLNAKWSEKDTFISNQISEFL